MMHFDDENKKVLRTALIAQRRTEFAMTASGLAALLSSALSGCVAVPPGALQADVHIPQGAIQASLGTLLDGTGTQLSGLTHHSGESGANVVSGGSGDTPALGGESAVSLPFSEEAVTSLNDSLGLDENNKFNYSELSSYFTSSFQPKEGFHDLFVLNEDSGEQTMYFQSYEDDTDPLLVYDDESGMLIALINNIEGDLVAISSYTNDQVVPMYDDENELIVQLGEKNAILFSIPQWGATFTVARDGSSASYEVYTRLSALETFGGEGWDFLTLESNYSYFVSDQDEQGENISYYSVSTDGTVDYLIGDLEPVEYITEMFENSTRAELVMMAATNLKKEMDDGSYVFSLVEGVEETQAEMWLMTILTNDPDSDFLMSGVSLTVIYDFDDGFIQESSTIFDSALSKDNANQYQLEVLPEDSDEYTPFGISFGLEEFGLNADVFEEFV